MRPRTISRLLVFVLTAALLLPAGIASAQTDTVGHRSVPNLGRSASDGGTPTGVKAESKLWFHDGVWWATLIHRDSSTHRIHRLVGTTWVDTGVVVDGHTARADVLHRGGTIWVTNRNTSKLARFHYEPGSQPGSGTWQPDPGFPRSLPVPTTAPGLTIDRDTTGTLWIAWLDGRNVRTSRSTDAGATWSAPATLPFPQATTPRADDFAAVLAFRDATGPAIGVMWSNQVDDAQYFAVHRDGAPASSWTLETALVGDREADDHINMKAFEDRVHAVVKTEKGQSGEELIKLLTRSPQGSWQQTPVAHVEEGDTRPITQLEIDPGARQLYVFMRRKHADGTSSIVYKRTGLAGLNFNQAATTFIRADQDINDPTSMKAHATASSGIVVMASTSKHYWWNRIGGTSDPQEPEPQVRLEVATVGAGTVSLDPPGGSYPIGTEVTLTAQADDGWRFDGWSGDATGVVPTTQVVLDGDRSVTATFLEEDGTPPPEGDVELAAVATGSATDAAAVGTQTNVSAGPGATYLAAVATRGSATAQAVDGLGLDWEHVATQCSGRGSGNVSLWVAAGDPTASSTVTAALSRSAPAATIAVGRYAGADTTAPIAGVARGNTNGTTGGCSGGTDSRDYELAPAHDGAGLIVAATTMRNRSHAPVAPATERAELSVGSGGNVNSIALSDRPATSTSPTAIAGTFNSATDWAAATVALRPAGQGGGDPTDPTEPVEHTLAIDTEGAGTVTADPPGGSHPAGTRVTLTATADDGWSFAGWGGDASGSDPVTEVVLDADRTVSATFTEDDPGGGDPGGGDPPPDGPPVVDRSVTGTATAASTVATSETIATGDGGVLVAAVASRDATPVAEVTSPNLTWEPVATTCTGRNVSRVSLWAATTPSNSLQTVTATFEGEVAAAVIAVTRYVGVDRDDPVGPAVVANTNGVDGACSGGTDGAGYEVSLPPGGDGDLLVGAVTMRNRRHTPLGGAIELLEEAAGSGGNVAGLATVEQPAGSGSLIGELHRDTDWGVIAVHLRGVAG